jgi:ArsR family transcriptional regulator
VNTGKQLDGRLRQAARFFYALKDPLRLRIIVTLARAGEMTVTELVRAVRVSQPLVSWHLARLRAASLVRVERDGRIARYSVDLEAMELQYADFCALLTKAPDSHE